MSEMHNRIGRNIGRIIEEKKTSQREVARLVPMNHVFLNKVINGKKPISVEKLQKIAKVLEVDVNEFTAEADHTNKEPVGQSISDETTGLELPSEKINSMNKTVLDRLLEISAENAMLKNEVLNLKAELEKLKVVKS